MEDIVRIRVSDCRSKIHAAVGADQFVDHADEMWNNSGVVDDI